MAFAKSSLDYFYANGTLQQIGGVATAPLPNLIALKDISSDTPNGGVIFSEGTKFYIPFPVGANKVMALGAEPIVLGQNARFLTDEERVAWRVANTLDAGTDVAQDVAKRALNEEGLVKRSNIAWWLLGGLVVYLIFIKK
jgi:hypothetical protein